jgi:hypothetical protein
VGRPGYNMTSYNLVERPHYIAAKPLCFKVQFANVRPGPVGVVSYVTVLIGMGTGSN